jgi:predicted ferric reductase
MTLLNLAFTTFLSLKNTPLALFSTSSYERLNIMHKAAGCTTALLAIIHPTVFLTTLSQGGYLFVVKEFLHFSGAIAACCMLLTVSLAVLLRRLRYELFYVIHVTLFMVIIIMIGFHRPNYATKSAYITTFAGSIWALDRLIRFTRLSWNSISNTATISPLPNGGTLVILNKRVTRMESGKHAFLWVPEIRKMETHPFTAVSNHPLKFVVSAHDGFTRDLHGYAVKNPGAILKASVDGPYGVLPNFCTYDRVLLIAGGSGASFTFGIALNMLGKLVNSPRKPAIEFVWVLRHEGIPPLSKLNHNYTGNIKLTLCHRKYILVRRRTGKNSYLPFHKHHDPRHDTKLLSAIP